VSKVQIQDTNYTYFAITLKQLSPFFTIILVSIWLREKITLKQCVIFIIAFLGVLLIIKPGFRSNIFSAIIGIIGAVLTAGLHIALRNLRLTITPPGDTQLFWLYNRFSISWNIAITGKFYFSRCI